MIYRVLKLCALLLVLIVPPAVSDSPSDGTDARLEAICPNTDITMTPQRYLRALSLELRGTLPTLEEYEIIDEGEVPAALIEGWLSSPEFVERAVRRHRDLLWPNISNVRLTGNNAGLARQGGTLLHWRRNPAIVYRGDRVPCLNQEVSYDDDGNIETFAQPDGTEREGYVMISPYWAPESQIKVCAFDAQDTLTTSNGTDCSRGGYNDPECGCGPDMNYCRFGSSEQVILSAMAQDLELRVADVIRNDRPYTDLFTSRSAYINGPLVHFYKHMSGVGRINTRPIAVPVELLPDLDFVDDDTWVSVQMGPEHAGILTSPLYLLRFQTNRARANRYYMSFLCQPFQPPAGGIPTTDGIPVLDLQVRDGCNYCHALLEPAAAHWGRWTETGIGYLNPTDYPAVREDCEDCAMGLAPCSADCRNNYVTSSLTPEEDPWLGWFRPYEFRQGAHYENVELGPRLLALSTAVDGRLPQCAATYNAQAMLGRPLVSEDVPWLNEMALDFVSEGFSYRSLIEDIVTSTNFRKVR